MSEYVAIDYINSAWQARMHLVRTGTMRTLCGITIEGQPGDKRGYQLPALSETACRSCPRIAAYYASKGAEP